MNRSNIFMKESPQRSSAFPPQEDTGRSCCSMNKEEYDHIKCHIHGYQLQKDCEKLISAVSILPQQCDQINNYLQMRK